MCIRDRQPAAGCHKDRMPLVGKSKLEYMVLWCGELLSVCPLCSASYHPQRGCRMKSLSLIPISAEEAPFEWALPAKPAPKPHNQFHLCRLSPPVCIRFPSFLSFERHFPQDVYKRQALYSIFLIEKYCYCREIGNYVLF